MIQKPILFVMKKTFKLLSLFIAGLFLMPTVNAQEMPQMPQLPVDKEVRVGTLPNGLTYYIRHNETPKGQADFYIAQKVGSILEEDNQRGLAHFLEHMCFNGTKHFPGNQIVEWLETVGVKFGQNLNAYTGFDETVYNISKVPTARESVQDSCLLILHDWANDLLLEGDEIDKERAVIHEEWRSRNVGQQRIMEQLSPMLYPKSKYGHRLPIGTMEVVDNFPHKALRDYYETWYRPDQQGVIVVGDIDVDRIENKIKELFADIEMPSNPKKREYFPVPDHKGTITAIGHDPEQKTNIVQMMWLSDAMPTEMRNTQMFYVTNYIQNMISTMLNNRYNEMLSTGNAPFAGAFAYFGQYLYSKTKDSFVIGGVAKKGDTTEQVLESIYREVLRAARGGFTQTEYDRAKNEYLSGIENVYKNRESHQSERYVNEYVRHFIDNDPIPGIEVDYQIAQQLTMMLPLQAINEAFAQCITDDNRVILALLPDNVENIYPTEQSLNAIVKKVESEKIEAFVDNVKTEPLIAALPAAGSIVAEKKNDQWGTTEWTLSNGVRVIIKPTEYKKDEILMNAFALEGVARLDSQYDADIILGQYSLGQYSLGSYTNNDLAKYLAGKQVGMNLEFDQYSREISGSTTPKDLETMMELIHMAFTDLHYDATEFKSLQSQLTGVFSNQESTPDYQFSKLISEKLFKSPRRAALSSEIINAATPEMTTKLAKAMTDNINDYTFTFVGNVDVKVLKPLVEKYIASIKGNPETAVKSVKEFNPDLFVTTGSAVESSSYKMQTPQTYVAIIESGDMPYTVANQKLASIAGQILSKRLIKKVREEMGAVYSISAQGFETRLGPSNAMIQTVFPMKPEMRDQVLEYIAGEFKAMAGNVTAEELDAVKEYMIKSVKESQERNEGWLNSINGWLINGVDTFNGAIDAINAITIDDVQNFMKQLNGQNNYRVIMLEPEK